MDNFLTHDAFDENLNTKFQVSADEANIAELELVNVSDLKLVEAQEWFSVVFRGPRDPFLPQGIRSLQHEKLGQADLFLVPIREDSAGYYYEAVFNRFRK